MERCGECGNNLRTIGNELYYCDDCDRIITRQDGMLVNSK